MCHQGFGANVQTSEDQHSWDVLHSFQPISPHQHPSPQPHGERGAFL